MNPPDIPPPLEAEGVVRRSPAEVAPADAPTWQHTFEQFARDYLNDRRSDRRWRVFFRLGWLLIGLLIVWAAFAARSIGETPTGPHTALIEIRGEIAADSEASAENLIPALKGAFEDPDAQAVVLRFNSPGGSPVQAGLINDEIRRLKALHKKKVYAVVEETCASGAYYIAVAADEIYADKASVIGSIGVLMDGFDFTGTMDKLGVRRRLFTAGANKGIADPFSPMSPAQRAYLQAMLDQIHQQFIAAVRAGRGARLKETPETFSGLFWNGQQAVEQGLVDHLGSLDYVAREVVKAEEVVDYTPKENVAERLAKRIGASMGAGAVQT
ncbi:MAG: signal peptide peptidase SppA, partial [Caldimonas sp.]